MTSSGNKIAFEHLGIAKALSNHRLKVPVNQRAYAWEEEHIRDLFQDLSASFGNEYFLGTIVLTGDPRSPEVADGQQRLATITIFLAAIRDYLLRQNDTKRAESIEQDFLLRIDRQTTEIEPNLTLNTIDNDFFRKLILLHPDDEERKGQEPRFDSHRKIQLAANLAREHVEVIVKPLALDEGIKRLIDWVAHLENDASIILVTVPEHLNAFRMFETLNDRGLVLSQADLLKNFLLDRAGNRIQEAHNHWLSMEGALETINGGTYTVSFIRHLFITAHGHTRERDLYDRISATIRTKQDAIDFSYLLATRVSDYVALLNPSHHKWGEYGTSTRKHVFTIHRHLQVEQIRPLMLAVMGRFSVKEVKKAFRMMVCWSVRFLVHGGRGGLLDKNYADKAHQIGLGKIKTASELHDSMVEIVPTDKQFEASFETASVSRSHVARYALRALEQQFKELPEPELIPNDDEQVVTVEHVLPKNPDEEWDITGDHARALYKRIGNIVLLKSSVNSQIGNVPFEAKRSSLLASSFALTRMVADCDEWGEDEIEDRQQFLAGLAVKTWPLGVD